MTPWLRRAAAAVALTVGALLALVVTAPPASAHAVLVSSNPPSGATLAHPPSTVSLTFDENVRAPAFVVVTGPGGVRVDDGKQAQILDATVTAQLKPTAPAGAYTVDYRVVSADGHPVEGQLTYTVTTGAPATASTGSTGSTGSAGSRGSTAAVASTASRDGGHLVHVLGGFAVVIAGAGALVFERLQRRRHPQTTSSGS
jgi:methionine-rich copper-binding protein CopC